MSEIAQSPKPPPADAAGAEPSLRHLVATALRHLLGDEGYQSIQGRNWTLVGVCGPVIGIVADVLQIFGPIASVALIVSASVFAIFLILVVSRTRACRVCAFPCVLALLLVVIFATVVGAQRLAAANEPGARDTGALAAAIPGIADLQTKLVDIAARLGVMERHLGEITDTTQRNSRKVDEVARKIDALPEALAKVLAQASDAEKIALHDEVDRLRQTGDIRDQAIVTFLKDVGETPLSADQYPAQLAKFVERYRSLLAEVEKPKNLPAQFEAERREAAEQIKTGDHDKADALLGSLRTRIAQWRREQQA
ncbi:MAG: hypothetical protein AB7H71_14965, partial [Alphaproteobacteria bacterium]